MTNGQIVGAATFFTIMTFCWLYYFRRDIRRWWLERGPRRQVAAHAAQQREAELARLRDELASKYLPPGIGTKPTPDG